MPTKKIFILIFLFLFTGCQAKTPESEMPSTDTPSLQNIDPVKLAWFYKPPEDGTPLVALAENFDTFVLTHYDEDERDELRELGVKAPFLQYLLFVQIQDPGSCDEEPYGNQVAYKEGDFCTISAEHPGWFLRDSDGKIIRKKKNVFMDPGNIEYREFWLARTKEMQEEYNWDGVFIDNVEASLNKFERLEQLPEKYPTDESYQAAVEGFLDYVYGQYFKPYQRPVYANIIEYEEEDVWLRYLNYLDGAMLEDFAVDYNDRYYRKSYWETQMNMSLQAQSMGKSLILVSQGEMPDTERARFSFASYLLVNNGSASFRYTDSDHYEDVWLYQNYVLDLGSPKGAFYESDGGWRRDFENGDVFVNPTSHISEIRIIK
ncbi:MAG: hypothetical protein GY755_12750 [Chloroflexi bacterium]|nr:hypothetical protein [Chloroflexota bacterium]